MSASTETSSLKVLTGCVKWFNNSLNYGFITVLTEGESHNLDVFSHQSNIKTKNDCFRTLYTGECVQFELAKSDNEKHPFHAVNITGFNGGMLHCENPNYHGSNRGNGNGEYRGRGGDEYRGRGGEGRGRGGYRGDNGEYRGRGSDEYRGRGGYRGRGNNYDRQEFTFRPRNNKIERSNSVQEPSQVPTPVPTPEPIQETTSTTETKTQTRGRPKTRGKNANQE